VHPSLLSGSISSFNPPHPFSLGIALKLTFGGNNQFIYASTYFFLVFVTVFLLFQLNYLNLSLDLFSAAAVSPVYYVFFTSCTILSNILLYQGFDGQTVDVVSDVMGFCAMVIGVFLLKNPNPQPALVPSGTYLPTSTVYLDHDLEMNSL